jgi:hypothetical protein
VTYLPNEGSFIIQVLWVQFIYNKLGVLVLAYKPSMGEAEAEGLRV